MILIDDFDEDNLNGDSDSVRDESIVTINTMIEEVEDTLIITATENIDISDDNGDEPS